MINDVVDDLDGSRGSAPFEVFAVNFHGWIARFDGQHWSILGHPDTNDLGDGRRHVVWLGPGEAIVSGADLVPHIIGGVLTRETRGVEGGRVTAVGSWPDVGSVAYWSESCPPQARLLLGVQGNWSPLDRSDPLREGVNAFVMPALPGGGLLAGKGAVLERYTTSLGLCPAMRLDGGWEIDYSTMMNGRPVLAGFGGNEPNVQSVVLFLGE